MIRRGAWLAFAISLFLPAMLHAQVPEVQGKCRSGCGSSSGGYSRPRSKSEERAHKHFVEAQRNDDYATRKTRDLLHKGRKAQAHGKYQDAVRDFGKAEKLLVDDHCEPPPGTYINIGKYNWMVMRKEQNLRVVREALAKARMQAASQPPPAPKPVKHAKAKDPDLEKRAALKVNESSSAMQQLRDAAAKGGGPGAPGAPAAGSICVAQGGGGSWGKCMSPEMSARLAANKKAFAKYNEMKAKRDEKQQKYDALEAQRTKIRNEQYAGKGNQANLAKQYSKVTNEETKVHADIAKENDKMNSFLVDFEESNKTASAQKPSR